jgi:hypothetical protein
MPKAAARQRQDKVASFLRQLISRNARAFADLLHSNMPRPNSAEEFESIAKEMAASGAFSDSQQIYYALSIWPDIRDNWWTQELATKINALCLRGRDAD